MDARRRLKSSSQGDGRKVAAVVRITALMVLLSLAPACASMPDTDHSPIVPRPPDPDAAMAAAASPPEAPLPADIPSSTERPYWTRPPAPERRSNNLSMAADTRARPAASAALLEPPTSRESAPTGRTFAYEADRVYDVTTAPLRITVVTLAPGETVLSRAAGDTLRWQIAETRSGSGATERVHVLLKPLERGLATNLVLATSGRLYLLALKSGTSDAFDQTVAWTYAAAAPSEPATLRPMDARYRIMPMGRAPRWTPLAVFTNGVRTEIIFPDGISSGEAPALIGRQADGSSRPLSYRQTGNLYLVDEVIEDAELRLGDRQPRVVRIRRLPGAAR